MSWQLGAFGLLAGALVAGFAWYERQRPDARIVALVGTLSAFAALGRIAFAAVPNVKPTTDIVLIAGYALGGGPGFAVGALAGLTSNFFFGQGPWTPWQMAAWGAAGIIGAGLARVARARRRHHGAVPAGPGSETRPGVAPPAPPLGRWPLAIVCCVVGFGFTVMQDVGDWVTYSDHSSGQLGAYVGQGLGFDAIHAAGCLMFALALGPALTRSIQRFARRLDVHWIPAGAPASGTVAPPLILILVLVATLTTALGPTAGVARAAASPATVRAGAVTYLLGAENADGGFGDAPGQPSSQLFAGWAALGLASAGRDLNTVAHGRGLMAYIGAAGAPPDVGSLERTILVVHAAGLSAGAFGGHDLVAELERQVRPDGSISEQVNLTAFAIMALRAGGVSAGPRTVRWLAAQQDRDGGFSFGGAGGSSDVDDTGATLEALAGTGVAGGVSSRAVSFLRHQQDRDGGFPSQPGAGSNAQSTAWAIQGLDAVGVSPAGLHAGGGPSPMAYLDSLAVPNGSIRYSRGLTQTPVWVTGEALMALEGKPLPVSAPAAPPAARNPAGSARTARPAGRTAAHVSRHAAHRRRAVTPASAASGRRSARGGRNPSSDTKALIPVSAQGLAGALGVVTALVLAPVGLG